MTILLQVLHHLGTNQVLVHLTNQVLVLPPHADHHPPGHGAFLGRVGLQAHVLWTGDLLVTWLQTRSPVTPGVIQPSPARPARPGQQGELRPSGYTLLLTTGGGPDRSAGLCFPLNFPAGRGWRAPAWSRGPPATPFLPWPWTSCTGEAGAGVVQVRQGQVKQR